MHFQLLARRVIFFFWLLPHWHQTRQDTTSKQASVPLMHSGGRQIVRCCNSWFPGSLMKPSTWAYRLSTGVSNNKVRLPMGGWHLFHLMPKILHEMKETCTCQENNNRKVVTLFFFWPTFQCRHQMCIKRHLVRVITQSAHTDVVLSLTIQN